jgi:hypothetical protein
MWLAGESGVHWFAHEWNYWDQEQDLGALECLGWRRTVVEMARQYRVTIHKAGRRVR